MNTFFEQPDPDQRFKDRFILCSKCLKRQTEEKHQCTGLDNAPYLTADCSLSVSNFKLTLDTKYRPDYDFRPPTPARGIIQTMSAKASRRMKLRLATFDYINYKVRFFATFTYGEVFPTDRETIKSDLSRLLKRIERTISECCIVWRVEYQKRGAPHFHLMILHQEYLNVTKRRRLAGDIRKHWGEITEHINAYSYTTASDIREISSVDKVLTYLSKYVAKKMKTRNRNYLAEPGE